MGQRKRHRQVNQVLRQTARLRQMQVALYQSKCRLADAVRRDRDKRVINKGGLMVVADLLDMDQDVVFGALLRAAKHLKDPERIRRWRAAGGRRFAAWRKTGMDPTLPSIPKSEQTGDPARDRRRMTRRLFQLGGLIEKAGHRDTDAAVLLGILMDIADRRNNPKALDSWKQTAIEDGVEKVAAEAAARARVQPVVVKFPGRIPWPVSAQLRRLGLSFNRKKRWWTGDADPGVALRIAGPAGGEVFVPRVWPP